MTEFLRPRFRASLFGLILGVCFQLLGALSPVEASERPPNIIFILADDLGYGDLGCYGQEKILTPHLDRMSREGTRFTQTYAGATVCAPSRSVLLTGLHTGNTHVRGNRREVTAATTLQPGTPTLATVLKSAGYRTAHIGKWGLGQPGEHGEVGQPERQGFDYAYGYLNQTHAHNSYPSYLFRNGTKVPLPNTVPDEWPVGAGVSDNKAVFAQDLFMAETMQFLQDQSQREEPFFLYFAPTLPHANNESRPFGLEIPDLGEYNQRDWTLAHKAYAAMVSRLDADVGRILDFLHQSGLDENTLVIFTSDNGPHQERGADPEWFNSSGSLRGIKRDLYEGGIRVPTIARWPGHVPADRVDDSPWYFPDVLPTLAALADVTPPPGLDGVNVRPLLLGQAQPELWSRIMYWEFHERQQPQALRQGPWKAVRPDIKGPIELYHLGDDPGETTDLALARPDVLARLEPAFRSARSPSPHWPFPMDPASTGQ